MCLSNLIDLRVFKFNVTNESEYCGIRKDLRKEYFLITNIYIFLMIILPMIFIFMINMLIMIKTNRADKKRRAFDKKKLQSKDPNNLLTMSVSTPAIDIMAETGLSQLSTKTKTKTKTQHKNKNKNSHCEERKQALMKDKFSFRFRPLYRNNEQIFVANSNRNSSRISYSHKINAILIFVSFSYVLLNLPYLITWFIFWLNYYLFCQKYIFYCYYYYYYYIHRILFFNKFAIKETNFEISHTRNYLFVIVQICEVIYLLNYCMHFYFYCLTGSRFLNQLNYSSKYFVFYLTQIKFYSVFIYFNH